MSLLFNLDLQTTNLVRSPDWPILVSNVIAVKTISPFTVFGYPVVLQAADLIFPVTYILGDILTEVYGFKRARKAIWIGFACNLFAAAAIYLGQALPANPDWHDQASYDAILGTQFRILSENGNVPQAHRAGWKDTVRVEGGVSEVLVKFDHEAPKAFAYMAHCHLLEHEDTGMMLGFTV